MAMRNKRICKPSFSEALAKCSEGAGRAISFDWRVDVLVGGFPCQDISNAGNKAGITGQRSGLWVEFARIICILRPRFVVVENVAALLVRGIDTVLRDLASLGYDAEWEVLSACQFGAPHSRERLFLVAYPHGSFVRTSGTAKNQTSPANVFVSRASHSRQLGNWWETQPEPCSVVYGVPGIVDRLRGYGNAVVPQVSEWVGRKILESI